MKVERSLADLEALRDRLGSSKSDLLAQGTEVTGLTIDVTGNRVIVDVVSLDSNAVAAVGKAAPGLGDGIALRLDEPTHADACPLSECLNPVKGGIGIQEDGSDDYPNNTPCTAGYMARRIDTSPDTLVIVTAGHCNEVLGLSRDPWQHGGSVLPGPNIDIGNIATKGGAIVETHQLGANADVGLINTNLLPAADVADKNQMLVGLDPARHVSVLYVWLHADTYEGMSVCRMGYRTLLKCGVVKYIDATKPTGIGNVTIDHLVVYTRDALGGDSGGPVFFIGGTPNQHATIVGTHVHSYDNGDGQYHSDKNGWYSPYDRGKNTLSNLLGVEITACLTNTCGF